jgi:molybdenum cofactor biosynthesis enzyme MoaA
LWRYCEDSARWVFQTETGNKNADRILAALRVAAKKGLTKWQITVDVFNRNVPKFEIDEALRLLHQLRLTYCVIEKTATKPAERWFEKPDPTKNTTYLSEKPRKHRILRILRAPRLTKPRLPTSLKRGIP